MLGHRLTPYRVWELACAGLEPGEVDPRSLREEFSKMFPAYQPDAFARENMYRAAERLQRRAN